MNTRYMQEKDIARVVSVHINAFPGFFLSFLGSSFLKILYKSILSDPSGIALVYGEQGKIEGFVAGSAAPFGLYTRLIKKHWWKFLLSSLGAIAKKPSIIPRMFRALTMPRQTASLQNCGTLMSIAVAPEAQGKGIGKLLVQAFLDEAKKRGLKQVNLTTDRLNNEATNHFYRSLGFCLDHSYVTPEGRPMNEYVYTIS